MILNGFRSPRQTEDKVPHVMRCDADELNLSSNTPAPTLATGKPTTTLCLPRSWRAILLDPIRFPEVTAAPTATIGMVVVCFCAIRITVHLKAKKPQQPCQSLPLAQL
jgi:hypothetical protein